MIAGNLFVLTVGILAITAFLEAAGADVAAADIRSYLQGREVQECACKSYPGDDDWPSDQQWQHLGLLLGAGSLIPTVPVGAPCYKTSESYGEEHCKEIVAGFGTTELHEADPTSVMWPIFQGRTCLPDPGTNGTCTLGGYPEYAVRVVNVNQIQHAINFSRTNNVRLVIKNTGHCYLGKSGGAGSLSLWMHHLRDIDYIESYPSTDYTGPALKVAAGATVREVYQAAKQYGGTAVGGDCPNVGFAGGYVQGGGHSALSSLLGAAADSVLAFEAVSASGQVVTASPTENSDLFWALRAGGGSTFAVVTSLIVKLHPKMPVTTSRFTFTTSAEVSTETFWAGVRAFYDNFVPWTDAGVYAYFFIINTEGVLTFQLIPFFAPNATIEQYNTLTEPWTAKLTKLGIPFAPNVTYWDDFYEAYDNNFGDDNPIGSTTTMPGNRLFPKSHFLDTAKLDATFAAVRQSVEDGFMIIAFAMVLGAQTPEVDNAVSSHFRDAISLHITNIILPEDASPAQLKTGSDELLKVLDSWGEAVPDGTGGGSYGNEAHVMEAAWQDRFYGQQYARLLEVKKGWDPDGVFYATTGVGSEEWEIRGGEQGVTTQNGRLCRVQ